MGACFTCSGTPQFTISTTASAAQCQFVDELQRERHRHGRNTAAMPCLPLFTGEQAIGHTIHRAMAVVRVQMHSNASLSLICNKSMSRIPTTAQTRIGIRADF